MCKTHHVHVSTHNMAMLCMLAKVRRNKTACSVFKVLKVKAAPQCDVATRLNINLWPSYYALLLRSSE